jgi:hypothetical protein
MREPMTYEQRQAHHISTDDGTGADEHPADDAAFYAGCARRTLSAVAGEAVVAPRQALNTLARAEASLRAALAEVARARTRICREYGLEER